MSITSHKDIIELWPSQAVFGREINQPYSKVIKWYLRERIPAEYWLRIVTAAHVHDFPITVKMMAELIDIDRHKKTPSIAE